MAEPAKPRLPVVGPDPGAPVRVHLMGRYALGVEWQDTHASIYPFDLLRASCPCAACAAARTADPPPRLGPDATWPTDIAREAGGLRIQWQDGHETRFGGRALRELCRCAMCAR